MNNFNSGNGQIATIDFSQVLCPGDPDAIGKMKKTARKPKSAKPIVHQIFADIALILKDPFWVKKFTQASQGKLPAKFSYNNGTIMYTKGKGKSKEITLPKNIVEAAKLCCQFFREMASIYSPLDKIEVHFEQAEQEEMTWSNAGKKCREILLSYFYNDISKQMLLNHEETKQLKFVVEIGILNKFLGIHNIFVENRRITGISGLQWNPQTRKFFLDPNLRMTETRSSRKKDSDGSNINKDTMPRFTLVYKKRLELLQKKCNKLNCLSNTIEQFKPSTVMSETSTDNELFTCTTDVDNEADGENDGLTE